jgi:ATP-dependent Clp protease ATP-binding subunit ClpC
MYEKFTDQARKVMQLAHQESQRFNHEYVGTEHLLLGLIKEGTGVAANILRNLDIDLRMVRIEVEKLVQAGPDMVTMGKLPMTPRTKKVLEYAIEESRNFNHNYVGTEHLLLGLIREEEGVAAQVLMNLGLKLEDLREEMLNLLGNSPLCSTEDIGRTTGKKYPRRTPALDSYGQDLTERVRQGKLDPVIGRQREIERVRLVLGCRTQNVPLLVGEAGVGKQAIIRGLAWAAVAADAPRTLADRRVIGINVARLILAVRDRADLFSKAVRNLAVECRQCKNVLLILDDLFNFDNSGKLLLAALVAEGVPCVLAITPEKLPTLAGDPVIDRHCQKIPVEPPTADEAVSILNGLRPRLQEHHRVQIADDALSAAVQLAERHVTEGVLPGKAIQVLDQACALVRLASEPREPEVKELHRQIELLTFEKEAAVAAHDFEKAAVARDRADKLQKEKERLLREWREKAPAWFGTVDAAAVAQVISKWTGVVFR